METPVETLSPRMGPPSRSRRPGAEVFTVLVRAHARLVRLAAWQAGAPEADLADVAQEVFLRLSHAIEGGLDTSAPLDGWLRRVAYTVTRDRLKLARNAREAVSATGELDAADTAPNPEEQVQAINLHRLVNSVLDELPSAQREVLVMSDIGEMPMSEIAQELGIPIGTGVSRLAAARKAFERKLRDKQAGGDLAVLPFALWGAGNLTEAARAPPAAPAGFEDDVVARVTAALAAGLAGPAAALTGGATTAAAASAANAGVVLTSAQIGGGLLAAMILGAGLHAAFVAGHDEAPSPTAALSARERAHAMGPLDRGVPATVTQVTPAPSAD